MGVCVIHLHAARCRDQGQPREDVQATRFGCGSRLAIAESLASFTRLLATALERLPRIALAGDAPGAADLRASSRQASTALVYRGLHAGVCGPIAKPPPRPLVKLVPDLGWGRRIWLWQLLASRASQAIHRVAVSRG
jgi:hypothetical protein